MSKKLTEANVANLVAERVSYSNMLTAINKARIITLQAHYGQGEKDVLDLDLEIKLAIDDVLKKKINRIDEVLGIKIEK